MLQDRELASRLAPISPGTAMPATLFAALSQVPSLSDKRSPCVNTALIYRTHLGSKALDTSFLTQIKLQHHVGVALQIYFYGRTTARHQAAVAGL